MQTPTQRDHIGYPYAPVPKRASLSTRTTADDQQYTVKADVVEDDRIYHTRPPTSSRRYPIPQQRVIQQGNKRFVIHEPVEVQPKKRFHIRFHWSVFFGVGMIFMFVLWLTFSWLAVWWQDTLNDQTYTQAFRTFSIDQAVGHNNDSASTPSHFIVQNDHRHLIIIEFPANDPSKAIIYTAPMLIGDGQDRTPVTLSFSLNPQTGRLDMVLHVQDQTYLFFNNGTKFLPPQQ